MKKIANLSEINALVKKMKDSDRSIVLVGGCFDILHYGHIKFLEKAKKEGGVLIVALESNEHIKRLKGDGRPIHSQEMRAEMLAALEFVDYVITLPLMRDNKDYLGLVRKVKPNIIAVTQNDPQFKNKEKQAKVVGAKVKIVTPQLKTPSTREIVKLLEVER